MFISFRAPNVQKLFNTLLKQLGYDYLDDLINGYSIIGFLFAY